MMQIQYLALLLVASTSLVAASGVRGAAVASHITKPIKDPAAKKTPEETLDVASVDMEIENMNYYEMTNEWEDPFDGEGKGPKGPNPNDWMMDMDNDAPKKGGEKDATRKGDSGMKHGPEQLAEDADEMADNIDKGFENIMNGELAGTVPEKKSGKGSDKKKSEEGHGEMTGFENVGDLGELPWPTGGTFVQVDTRAIARQLAMRLSKLGTMTVQKALKESVESAVKKVLECQQTGGPSPGPAPAPMLAAGPPQPPSGLTGGSAAAAPSPATALVQKGVGGLRSVTVQAAGPAPAPAAGPSPAPGPASPPCQQPKVHVAVLPGKKMKKKHMINQPANGALAHQTVMLRVSVFERPGNGMNDMAGIKTKLKKELKDGDLKSKLVTAIEAVSGVKPILKKLKVQGKEVALWNIQKCGSHMSNIVKSFTLHYTRRQVPLALYNECNTFMTKMSFSHDYVLDTRDAAHCREATKSFAQRWKLGKKDNPKDFENMCVNFCKAKYGNDAPNCHFA